MESSLAVDFVRLCLVSSWDPSAKEAAILLAHRDEFDWNGVLAAARNGFAVSLLYGAIKDEPFVPLEIKLKLRETYLWWAKSNLYTTAILEKTVKLLTIADIDHVLLKGAGLISLIYDNLAMRPLRDIDLLVHKTDVPRAVDVLMPLGFKTEPSELSIESSLQFESQLFLARRSSYDVYLELHWQLIDSPHHQQTVPIEWYWDAARPVQLYGQPAMVFGPEAQLLHLCSHLILHHRGEGLLWWHDIAELLRRYKDVINWEILFAEAYRADLLRPLQETLPIINRQWSVQLPAEPMLMLAELNATQEELRSFEVLTASHRGAGRRFWDDFWAFPRWSDRLTFATANLFPSPAYMRQRYGIKRTAIIPLTYPYRWLLGFISAFR